jgi:ATP-dependent exoDNAse (exonuclease V) alpha subunit
MKDLLILTGTRADAAALNQLAQAERLARGELSGPHATVGKTRFFGGDRVVFGRNSTEFGVKNGTLGTVVAVAPFGEAVAVRLDGGGRANIPLAAYPHVQLGYATTTHKGQGVTVDLAFVLTSEAMQDREMTYVQASRARDETRIYTDRATAGDDLADLARQAERSHQKELAHDLADRAGSTAEPALEVTP